MKITAERLESLCKVKAIFDKYLELQRAVRALNEKEYELLITSLENSLKEENSND